MIRYLFVFSLLISQLVPCSMAQESLKGPVALVLIDIQDFYFPGGRMELSGAAEAELQASRLLEYCRKQDLLVVHVMHRGGGAIRKPVAPAAGEKVIEKTEVNAFLGTDLADFLRSKGIAGLVLAGMQTNMCLEAATRAASDMGFGCTVIHDACAARGQEFNTRRVAAADIHAAALITLKAYARVLSLEEYQAQAAADK